MRKFAFQIDQTNPVSLFDGFQTLPYALFLDSADRKHRNAQKSFIFIDPKKTFENGFAELENADGILAGYFGYDLGRELEDLQRNTKPCDASTMAIGLYDAYFEFDHCAENCSLFVYADDEQQAEQRKKELLTLKKTSQEKLVQELKWIPEKSQEQYERDVQKITDYILAGDVFQVNLSQQFSAGLPEHFCPWAHYKILREINPAPFASYFNTGTTIISSASPERFLTLENGVVETRPIKGTLPISQDPSILKNSEKDRAENIMIVDLLRNDLSKVCEADSIKVPKLCELETFASVHHLVSTVTGQLKQDKTPLNLIKACFPGGSITGAPKIRAMEIIEELETHGRGPYCGSMGYIFPDGIMDTNILIRTLVYTDEKVTLNSGGGITANSNSAAEYQETLDKAARIFESFQNKKEEAA